MQKVIPIFLVLAGLLRTTPLVAQQDLEVVVYNNPDLVVDLGVGLWAWPLPMDWDQDGDLDLVVACPDKPYSGTYFFENKSGHVKMPVFEPGVKVGKGRKNLRVSFVDDQPRVLDSSTEFVGFLGKNFEDCEHKRIVKSNKVHQSKGNQRFNVWSYIDYDHDGRTDIMVGADDWGYYGWDDGFDADGNWKRGPLHGVIYILKNQGSNAQPRYANPVQLQADGRDINVYGNPMPSYQDFDLDGDDDLICGEFLDGFTYFENIGTREQPEFSARGYLFCEGKKIGLHVQMITPTAIDWDGDGDVDLIVGDEDGRVALVENTGNVVDGVPQFLQPAYFQQRARDLKFGALVTPVSFDWDQDGDQDLVCGNTSGNIAWFENLDGGNPPKWSAPRLIHCGDSPIHLQAGPNGSIQGPAEAKWGYTTLSVADWDHDGRHDLIVNSIWGKVEWFPNVGTASSPRFEEKLSVRVDWQGGEVPKPSWTWWEPGPTELATQWRTTPVVVDWNHDGLNDLVMLDQRGVLTFYPRTRRDGELWLQAGEHLFYGQTYDNRHRAKSDAEEVGLLQLNVGQNGSSGRRKLWIVDWDGDGRLDLLANSVNAHWLLNTPLPAGQGASKSGNSVESERILFVDQGPMAERVLAGHTTSPTTVDWDDNGIPDLLLGAEDGRMYYMRNPRSDSAAK